MGILDPKPASKAEVAVKLDKTEAATTYGRSAFPSSRLVLAGDSLTDYEDSVSGSGSQWSPRGPWTWALIYLNQRLDVVKNAGIAGNTSTALLARYDADVIAFNPGIVSLLIGTNDPAAAIPLTTTQANITAMLDKNRAAGAVTVIRTIPPQDADDTTKKNFRIQLNNWIKTLTSRKDVIVIDIMPNVTNPATGNYAASMSYDAVHFGALGAQAVGKKMADALAPILPAWDRLPSSAFDPDNYLTNGWMVGDGATYHEATGWTFSGTGLVLSKVARTDGVQGEWQQIVTTAAESTQKLNRTITLGGAGQLAVGDTVQCFTEFETDAANWGSVAQFHTVAIAKNGGTPTWYAYSMLSQGSDHWPSATFRAEKGVFATPKFVIPANSTVIEFRLVFNGIGTVRWGRSVIKKA